MSIKGTIMFLRMNNTRLEWKILIFLDFENGFLPTYLPLWTDGPQGWTHTLLEKSHFGLFKSIQIIHFLDNSGIIQHFCAPTPNNYNKMLFKRPKRSYLLELHAFSVRWNFFSAMINTQLNNRKLLLAPRKFCQLLPTDDYWPWKKKFAVNTWNFLVVWRQKSSI